MLWDASLSLSLSLSLSQYVTSTDYCSLLYVLIFVVQYDAIICILQQPESLVIIIKCLISIYLYFLYYVLMSSFTLSISG